MIPLLGFPLALKEASREKELVSVLVRRKEVKLTWVRVCKVCKVAIYYVAHSQMQSCTSQLKVAYMQSDANRFIDRNIKK